MVKKRWTADEEQFLKENYSGDAIKSCAEALGRTADSVKKAAARLSLTARHEHLTTDEQA